MNLLERRQIFQPQPQVAPFSFSQFGGPGVTGQPQRGQGGQQFTPTPIFGDPRSGLPGTGGKTGPASPLSPSGQPIDQTIGNIFSPGEVEAFGRLQSKRDLFNTGGLF